MARIDTDNELLQLGECVTKDPTRRGFLIGDPPRPVTNVEMHAACLFRRREVERAAAAGTCQCEDGPYIGGACRHVAAVRCPLWTEAEKIVKRMENEGND
jgi:hypothetical protein